METKTDAAGNSQGTRIVAFFAAGTPAPKGSTKAFMRPGMRFPVVTADNGEKQRAFGSVVSFSAVRAGLKPMDGPVSLNIKFIMPRPKSLPKRVTAHCKKPDIDKLTRLVADALTGIAYVDDSQIVALSAFKSYAAAGQITGAEITIYRTLVSPTVDWKRERGGN